MMPFFGTKKFRPFYGTPRDSFSTLARILPFPRIDPDSAIFRYSHRIDLFPVLAETLFRHSHGFYLFPVLTRIMSFFGTKKFQPFSATPRESFSTLAWILPFLRTDPDSAIFRYLHRFDLFWYSPGRFFDTRTDSTFSRY